LLPAITTWNLLRYCPKFKALDEVTGPPQYTHFGTLASGHILYNFD
jgi:hypothetical protein